MKRGYKRDFVTKQIQRSADIPRIHTLQPKQINKPERIPFITTYNPSLLSIFNVTKKHYNPLLSSDRCKTAFLHLPVVAFRRSPNLRDVLITAKLSPNVTRSNSALPPGSFSLWQKLRYLSSHFPWTNQLHILLYWRNMLY